MLWVVSLVGLTLTIAPVGARWSGALDDVMLKHLMLAGTVLWFAAATARDACQAKPR